MPRLRTLLTVLLLASPAAAQAPGATMGILQTRPIDRATVRIFSLLGVGATQVRGNRSGLPRTLAMPDVAHGSGLAISEAGDILTAKHVVAGADVLAVLFPGDEHAYAAEVMYADPQHDIAFIRVRGPIHEFVALPATPPPLQMLERVSATGYPLDPHERMPAATSGEVSRVNNDGRIQLAMALNPGNSGGPVLDAEGRLVGVVSQGSDPTRGAQGITLIEPTSLVLAAHAAIPNGLAGRQTEEDLRAQQEVAQLVADLVHAGPWGLVDNDHVHQRLGELSQRTLRPQVSVLVAAHLWNLLMNLVEERGVPDLRYLAGPDDAHAHELVATIVRLCRDAQAQDPAVRQHYAFAAEVLGVVDTVAAHTCGGANETCCYGSRCGPGLVCGVTSTCAPLQPCTSDSACANTQACISGACAPRPPPNRVHFQLRPVLALDDVPGASTVDGGGGGVGLTVNFVDFGPSRVRFSGLAGADFVAGTWRSSPFVTTGAHVGMQASAGGSFRGVARVLYTPGLAFAESRTMFAYASYRLEAMLQTPAIAFGISWQEAQRAADSTLRLLGLLVEFGW